MRSTGDDVMAMREFINVHFLIEQQLRLLDDLDRRGLDRSAAHALLRRLMCQDDTLRRRTAARGPLRTA